MKRLAILLTAGLLAAICPTSAFAGGPLYVTGAILNASSEIDIQRDFERLVDDDDDGWSLGVGFHIGKHLAIEGVYHDLGSGRESSICNQPDVACIAELVAPGAVDSTAVSVSVLPHWPVTEHFSIYGRVGIATWESDVTQAFVGTNLDTIDDEEFVLGVGVRFAVLGPLGAFAEISRIADTFETVSLGATLGF